MATICECETCKEVKMGKWDECEKSECLEPGEWTECQQCGMLFDSKEWQICPTCEIVKAGQMNKQPESIRREPVPKNGDRVVIDAVVQDFADRAHFGKQKYGQHLQTHDGRDNLTDIYQELIDSVMYVKKEIMERERPRTISALQKEIHENAVIHGWWETDRPKPEILCLVHSEVSEALEAYRNHDDENFAEELADIVIRVLDAAGGYGINLEAEILKKHEINKKREYRHGGKAA